MRSACCALVLVLLTARSVVGQAALPVPELPGFPIRIERATVIQDDDALMGNPADMVIRPDGALCLTDLGHHRVSCFRDTGALLFHSGRKGQGPGEYGIPYRIAAFPDNSLAVLDLAAMAVTHLDAEGKFLARWRLPIVFRQVNGMLTLNRERLLVAGVAPSAGRSRDSAVHLFAVDTALHHLASFAPLPVARDPEVLGYWGAGEITRMPGGALLYSRRLPYELMVYAADGRPLRTVAVPAPVSESPDALFEFTETLSSSTIRSTGAAVTAPGRAVALTPSFVLVQRTTVQGGVARDSWWDGIELPSGRLAGSVQLPAGLGVVAVAGVTREGTALLAMAIRDEAPALVWLDIARAR